MEQKPINEFLNKGWGLRGLNKLLKKLQQETGIMARRSGSIERIQNLSCFLFCNIYTQTGYCKSEISSLVANFLTHNTTTKHYIKSVNV